MCNTSLTNLQEIDVFLNGDIEQPAHEIVRTAAPRFALNTICQYFLISITDAIQASTGNTISTITNRAMEEQNEEKELL